MNGNIKPASILAIFDAARLSDRRARGPCASSVQNDPSPQPPVRRRYSRGTAPEQSYTHTPRSSHLSISSTALTPAVPPDPPRDLHPPHLIGRLLRHSKSPASHLEGHISTSPSIFPAACPVISARAIRGNWRSVRVDGRTAAATRLLRATKIRLWSLQCAPHHASDIFRSLHFPWDP